MSNAVHNLDEGQAEYFEFILEGNGYLFRYPTTEEVRALKPVFSETVGENSEQEQLKALYKFITPKEGSPDIAKVMGKVNIKKQQRFAQMIASEFTGNV